MGCSREMGLRSKGGCFFAFLAWYDVLGLDESGGPFLFVAGLGMGWLGFGLACFS